MGAWLALLVIVGMAPVAVARAADCHFDSPPTVQVNIVPWNIRYDYSRTQVELSAMVQRQAWLKADYKARGLFDTRLMHRKLIDFQEQTGGWTSPNCLGVSHVSVDLTFHDPVIYLAKELQWADCVAREVRAHEQKHARVDQELLAWFRPYMEGEVAKWAVGNAAVEVTNIPAGKSTLDDQLDKVIDRAIEVFTKERARRQAMIDTPQEYQRVEAACPNNFSKKR